MSRDTRMLLCSIAAAVFGACAAERPDDGGSANRAADPSPTVSFTQDALAVGLTRSDEPPSASTCTDSGGFSELAYGTFLLDLDGDGRLDVYDVNHGQGCHLSGMWLNDGAGGFGKNLFSVAMASAPTDRAAFALTNQVAFYGDFTGDGRVDMYFFTWNGGASLCVNQGNATHPDWTGPSFVCGAALAARSFADVNGDGKLDLEILDPTTPYDVYRDYCRTLPTIWKLNDGSPEVGAWPTDADTFHFVGLAAPGAFLDFNRDGLPDKIQGVEVGGDQRGGFNTLSGGLRVFLGQADGTYLPVTSGLEDVLEPVASLEDIDEDGCLDVGTDVTGYRGNQRWYVQNRSGSICLATFHAVARTALPYDPGARHYTLDVDNDGLLDKAVIVHVGYGADDGVSGGVHIFRKLATGGYQDLGASGIDIFGTDSSEFYADDLSPGDWNDDGKVDLAGVGTTSIAGSDAGSALWTSTLVTTNRWIKVRTPSISGFFPGAATIEIFDAGFAGHQDRLVTPPLDLRAGLTWAGRVYHFGVGTRSTVDVEVRFPDGRTTVKSAVATNTTVTVQPPDAPPSTAASVTVTASPPMSSQADDAGTRLLSAPSVPSSGGGCSVLGEHAPARWPSVLWAAAMIAGFRRQKKKARRTIVRRASS